MSARGEAAAAPKKDAAQGLQPETDATHPVETYSEINKESFMYFISISKSTHI